MNPISTSASHRWMLPEGVADLLPAQAEALESLRRRLLDGYRRAGYRLVEPPLIQYLDSLLIGSGRDLDLTTFKLVDQVSGRTLGVRADITPQVARIDAHLLQGAEPARLCYCGSVLHAVPAVLGASREPVQIGAELYGHAGPEADIEIIDLLLQSLRVDGVDDIRIDLSDLALVRLLLQELPRHDENALFAMLESRDLPGMREWLDRLVRESGEQAGFDQGSESPQARAAAALLQLPRLAGPADDVLTRARKVFAPWPQAVALLDRLACIATSPRLAAHAPRARIGIDLSDTRGFRYHTGLSFAAFVPGRPHAIGRGGRYDGVGRAFGRARPATGFSLDLRELVELRDHGVDAGVIEAPWSDDAELIALIHSLRADGEVVVQFLPGQARDAFDRVANRVIAQQSGAWRVIQRT